MSDKSKGQSAIDTIHELKESMDLLNKKIDVIDTNIKLLNNKLAKISKQLAEEEVVPSVSAIPVQISPSTKPAQSTVEKLVLGNIKTFGHLQNKNKEPIVGVKVNIYNSENQIIKSRDTDSSGYWEVRLPPGKYGVEYLNKGFKPINFSIELKDTMKEFGVK